MKKIEAKLNEIKELNNLYEYYAKLCDGGANCIDKVKKIKEEITIAKNQLDSLISNYIYSN